MWAPVGACPVATLGLLTPFSESPYAMRFACLLFALVLTAGACSTPPHDEPMMNDSSDDMPRSSGEAPMKQISLGEPFTLQAGEKALFAEDDVEIRFNNVTNDSRCPANATCVRAGEAVAHFTLLEADGTATPFSLEMPGLVMEMPDPDRVKFQQVDRFSVALYLLQPYPELAEEEGMPTTATLEMRRTMR